MIPIPPDICRWQDLHLNYWPTSFAIPLTPRSWRYSSNWRSLR